MTTLEPGARLDLTQGLRLRPRSTARLARRPAPTITAGFDVFVQLVIAAMTTAPCSSWNVSPSSVTVTEAGAGAAVATGTRSDGTASWPGSTPAGGSLAGKDSATASSSVSLP